MNTNRIRLAFALVLMLACFNRVAFIYAHFIGNLAWVFFTKAVLAEEVCPELYSRTTRFVGAALEMGPDLPRLSVVQQWFEGYQVRAAGAQQNRADRAQIKAAIRSSQASGTLDTEEEQQLWELALQKNDVEAWLVLASVYESRGDSLALRQILGHLDSRPPEQSISNDFTISTWRLEGYDWHPLSTDLYQQARIVLYWRAISQSVVSLDAQAGIYQLGDRMLQVIVARNLIANGNMEWISFDGVSPLPHPWLLAFHDARLGPTAGMLVRDERSVGNGILRLSNVYDGTILYTLPRMEAGVNYLLIGQVRTSGNGTYMVMENVQGVNHYPLNLRPSSDNDWRSYAGVFSPVAAQYIGVYLGVSGDPAAMAEYDNLGLFEINLPQMR